jgi:ABC-type lipoprotein export system ATPase subunit
MSDATRASTPPPGASPNGAQTNGTPPSGAPARDAPVDRRRHRRLAPGGRAAVAGVPAVLVDGVTKVYADGDVHALRGVDLVVQPGELVAITGPSGCGKSTLLHLLAALDRPTSGRIEVFGQDLAHIGDLAAYRRSQVGLVFQLHNLLPLLTAAENVMVAMDRHRGSMAEHRQRALSLLDRVGLAHVADRKPAQLSGGERQRVAIARALANDPPLLLADEPTGSLDSQAVTRVVDVFRRLCDETATTIVLVTHDLSVAAGADRTVAMADGRVVEGAGVGGAGVAGVGAGGVGAGGVGAGGVGAGGVGAGGAGAADAPAVDSAGS